MGDGIVSSVGVNAPTAPELAIDPEASAGSKAREAPRGPTAFESGPSVTVHRKDQPDDGRTRPSGRIRMPKG